LEKVLKITGIILIILGAIGGIIILTNIDWDSYKIAKNVFDELYTNELAEAQYVVAKQVLFSQLSLAIGTMFSGVISGFLFLGLSEGLGWLKKINHNVYITAKNKEEV